MGWKPKAKKPSIGKVLKSTMNPGQAIVEGVDRATGGNIGKAIDKAGSFMNRDKAKEAWEKKKAEHLASKKGMQDTRDRHVTDYGSKLEESMSNRVQEMKAQQMDRGQVRDVQAGQMGSAASNLFNRATDKGMQQQAAMAAGGKGVGGALAQRQATQNQAAMSQTAAGQAAEVRIKEQNDQIKFDLEADLANQGVDFETLKTNVLEGNKAATINIEAKLKERGLDQEGIRDFFRTQLGVDKNKIDELQGPGKRPTGYTEAFAGMAGAGIGGYLGGAEGAKAGGQIGSSLGQMYEEENDDTRSDY